MRKELRMGMRLWVVCRLNYQPLICQSQHSPRLITWSLPECGKEIAACQQTFTFSRAAQIAALLKVAINLVGLSFVRSGVTWQNCAVRFQLSISSTLAKRFVITWGGNLRARTRTNYQGPLLFSFDHRLPQK